MTPEDREKAIRAETARRLKLLEQRSPTLPPPGAYGDAIIILDLVATGPPDDPDGRDAWAEGVRHLARGWTTRYAEGGESQ